MTEFDQAQSPRIGQQVPYEGTTVRFFTGEELPEVSVQGQIIYRSDVGILQVYNAELGAWEDIAGGTAGALTYVGPDEPATPPSKEGDSWYDSDNGHALYIHNGGAWQPIMIGLGALDPEVTDQLDQAVAGYVVEYAIGSETVAPTTGWSTDTPVRDPGEYIWFRTTITHGDGSTSQTSPALLTGNEGAQGPQGDPGPQGDAGPQGIPGPAGADGTPRYTWIKYADTPTTGIADDPTGKTYMGIAYNKLTATESSTYSDYEWSLIQGPQGNQGIQGPAGADGQPTYTWVKYGTSNTGAGINDDPTGMTYIGLAYNKTTATESTDPTQYQWALIQGPQGTAGKGISSTTIRYQVSSSGTVTPTGTWQTTVQATSPGQFLWTRTQTNFTDSTTISSYSVSAHGSTGSAGKGVSTTDVTYQVGSSGTSAPTGTWQTTVQATSPGQFLWTRTIITYTDATTSTTYSVSAHGSTGSQGVSVNSITPYWAQVATGVTPTQPTTADPPASPWQATEPAYAAGTELWRVEKVTYSNLTISYTTQVKSSSYYAATYAVNVADSKIRLFQEGEFAGVKKPASNPTMTAQDDGDLWMNADEGNKPYIYEHATTSWIAAPFGLVALDTAVTTRSTLPGDIDNASSTGVFVGTTITGPLFQTRSQALRGIKVGTVETKEGLYVYDEDGVPFLKAVPLEGMAVIAGEVKASTATVTDGTSLGGVTEITRAADGTAGVVRLTAYTTAPKSAPTVTSDYDKTQFTDDGFWADRHGWSTDGTYWYTAREKDNGVVVCERYPSGGGSGTVFATVGTTDGLYGSVVNGSDFYVLYQSPGPPNQVLVDRYNTGTGSWTGTAEFSQAENAYGPAIGYDAAANNILIADVRASDVTIPNRVRIKRFTWPAIGGDPLTAVASGNVDTDYMFPYDIAGVSYGSFDLGANRYVVTARSGHGQFVVCNTTGNDQLAEDWEAPARRVGFAYTGGAFVTQDFTGTARTFSGQDKTTAIGAYSMTKNVVNTLANATYETDQSPIGKLAMPKRSKPVVNTSAINTGGANAPDRTNIYIGSDRQAVISITNGSTTIGGAGAAYTSADIGGTVVGTGIPNKTTITAVASGTSATISKAATATNATLTARISPGRTGLFKQTDPSPTGSTSVTYSSIATGTANPPATNGFLNITGTVQKLEAAVNGFYVDGQSNGDVGSGTFRDSVRTAVTEQDSGYLNASGSFAGTARFVKKGSVIYVYADITRATSFATAYTSVGITIPSWAQPASPRQMQGSIFFNSTATYQFRVTATTLDLRQSAANTASMVLAGVYYL